MAAVSLEHWRFIDRVETENASEQGRLLILSLLPFWSLVRTRTYGACALRRTAKLPHPRERATASVVAAMGGDSTRLLRQAGNWLDRLRCISGLERRE